MKKVLYVPEEMGFPGIYYDLFHFDKNLHDQFMKEIYSIGYLEDLSYMFSHHEDINLIGDSFGVVILNNKPYGLSTHCQKNNNMRSSEEFHHIVESFNNKLENPKKIVYKPIPEKDLDSVYIIEEDDGTETIIV